MIREMAVKTQLYL